MQCILSVFHVEHFDRKEIKWPVKNPKNVSAEGFPV